jgi:hypothetical protein
MASLAVNGNAGLEIAILMKAGRRPCTSPDQIEVEEENPDPVQRKICQGAVNPPAHKSRLTKAIFWIVPSLLQARNQSKRIMCDEAAFSIESKQGKDTVGNVFFFMLFSG